MKKVNRWIAAHPRQSKLAAALILTVLSFLILNPNTMPFPLRFLIIFTSMFYAFLYINTCPERLIRQPLQILEQQCDPYPFLEEMSFILGIPGNESQAQISKINYAMALRQVGRFEEVLSLLREISPEQIRSAPELTRLVYCNNMADVLTQLDRFSEAENWYEQARSLYLSLPEGKLKENCAKPMQLAEAESLYRSGDYTQALRIIARLSCQTQRFLMDSVMLAARCDIALSQWDKATEKLNYVIAHGNKLHCVQQAKSLLP